MSTRQTLFDQLAILRLSAFREALEDQFASPQYDELPFEERLALLVQHECTRREDNRMRRRIRQACFQQTAWIQDLDFSPGRNLPRALVLQLAQGDWIRRGLNLVITGPTGAGKSFLACALGHAACQQDYTVRYFRLPRFFQAIHFAQMEDRYAAFLKSLSKTHLLILDDWLRDKPSLAETQTLLDILDDRYGRMTTMLVSQIPVPDWHPRFPDPTLADAILDRLLHNAYRINLQGDSQRKLRAKSLFPST